MVKVDPLLALRHALQANLSPTFHAEDGSPCSFDACHYIRIPRPPTPSASGQVDEEGLIFERACATNFLSKRGAGPAYTLNAVCLLLDKRDDSYTDYLQEARKAGVPLVSLVDKRDLVEYVMVSTGEECPFVDRSAELPEARSTFADERALLEHEASAAVAAKRSRPEPAVPLQFKELYSTRDLMHVEKDFSWIVPMAKEAMKRVAASTLPREGEQRPADPTKSLLDDLRTANRPKDKPAPQKVGPPIVILPTSMSALVTMWNARAFFVNSHFQTQAEAKASGHVKEPTLQVTNPSTSRFFEFIDNPSRLSGDGWSRVCAVVVSGDAWQFKGWKWDTPQALLQHARGIHFHYDDDDGEWRKGPVGEWRVKGIGISRTRRHLDRTALMDFWSYLSQAS